MIVRLLLILILLSATFWNCSNESLAGGSEIGNPETTIIAGMVFEEDGSTPASGALVKLRPQNYLADTSQINRQSISGQGKDTIANSNGEFFITNLDTGKYYLEIQGQASQGIFTAVYISEIVDTLFLGEHFLKKTGSITGAVENSFEGNQAAYVQIYGMDKVAPVDPVTQQYEIHEIPEGDFTLKILSSAPNISPVEVKASTVSNDTLKLSAVTLRPFYSDWKEQEKFYLNTSITGANIYSDVYGFPLLLRLSEDNVDFDNIRPEEIRMANHKGQPLVFEIESWDAQNKTAQLWVLLDTVFAQSTKQYISLLWGNSEAVFPEFEESVFSLKNGFSAVWHFEKRAFENEANIKDWSGNNNHGVSKGQWSDANYEEGVSGASIFLDGVDDYISFANTENIPIHNDSYTLSGWIQVRDMGVYSMLGWGEYTVKKSNAFRVAPDFGGGLRNYWYAHDLTVETGDISGQWRHVVALYDGIKRKIYMDGMLMGEDVPDGHDVPYSHNLTIGTACCDEFFTGKMDELRISKAPRSESWIKLSYQNQKPGQTLLEKGLEEWEHSASLVLSLDSLDLSQDVNGYPLLLKLHSGNFNFDETQVDGSDLRFTDVSGIRLSHEIEYWDKTGEQGVVWILYDSISADLDSLKLRMYWGNNMAGISQNPGQVFKNELGFAGVWHLSEEAQGRGTSNVYRNFVEDLGHGADSISSSRKTGWIGRAAHFVEGDYIPISKSPLSFYQKDNISISTWVKLDSLDLGGGLIFTMGDNYGLRFTQTGVTFWTHQLQSDSSVFQDREVDWNFLGGSWHHLVATFNTDSSFIFIDGSRIGSFGSSQPIQFSRYSYSLIGRHIPERQGLFQFYGSLDELRLYSKVLSGDWIALDFFLQSGDKWTIKKK